MAANTVQKATLAIAAAVLAITVAGYVALASPVAAQTSTSSTAAPTGPQARMQSGWMAGFAMRQGGAFQHGGTMMVGARALAQSQVNISVGQKFTMTSTEGKYYLVGAPSANGTASGTLTFTVTGKLTGGYTVSISSGSVTVAGTAYTIASGTAQMNRGASGISGQGMTTPAGQFILRAAAHGSFVGSTGLVSLDLQSGTSEYLVVLAGSMSS